MKYLPLIIMVFSISLSSCWDSNKKNEKNNFTITAGVHSWPGGGIIYIGDEMGFFEKEGINLKIRKIENFDSKRASLISGNIDIDVANTLDQLLIYNENDFPAQIIGITDESVGGDGIVAKDNIKTLADLSGKTVAYAEASPSDFYLRYVLSKNNVKISKVKLKPVADPQIAGNSMISKQVDAAVTYEPFLSQAAKEKGISILSSTKDYPTLIPGLLLANKKHVAENEKYYEAFLRAWFKSVDYYYSHKLKSEKIIAKRMEMNLIEVQEILSVVMIQTKEQNQRLIDKSSENNLYELINGINSFWKSKKFVSKTIKPYRLINKSLINKE